MAVWSREKVSRLSKGFLGRRKNCFTIQIKAVFKSLQYQYIWRRLRRRVVKSQYIRSINAATRECEISYSKFIYGLNRSNINIDRKILSELAKWEPYSFRAVLGEISSQVKLPTKSTQNVTYDEALSKGLLYKGPYVKKESRDYHARYIEDKTNSFGTERRDYPYFFKEEIKNFNKQFMNTKAEKKLPPDFYDEIPDFDEDEPIKY